MHKLKNITSPDSVTRGLFFPSVNINEPSSFTLKPCYHPKNFIKK